MPVGFNPQRELFVSHSASVLFLAAAAYLVLPVLDVPYWSVSWSTPAFVLVAIEVFFNRRGPHWKHYSSWIVLACALWGSQFVSLLGNTFAGEITSLAWNDVAWLLRYGLWMAVFLATVVLISSLRLGPRLVTVLGLAVLALAGLRLAEAVLHGAVGAANTVFLSQNKYGWGFSVFLPFAVCLAGAGGGWPQRVAFLGLIPAALAVAINGSRSSWIAVLVAGILTLAWLLFGPLHARLGKRMLRLSVLGVCAAAATLALPPAYWEPLKQRAQTFQTLRRDKPFLARQVMLQKAALLFEQNPVFGVGPGHFRSEPATLELPAALRHRTQDQYNRRSAHNSYAAVLAETGLVGALPFAILLLACTFGGARAVWRHCRRGEFWAIPIYTGFIGMCLHLWTLSGLSGTAAWFVMGLVAALIQRETRVTLRERRYVPDIRLTGLLRELRTCG